MSCIVSPLTYTCNKVLSAGMFCMRLKYSQISPIFKKGDKTEMSKYGPISLLTSFSKIVQRVIYNRWQFHIHSNNILAQEENGFRSNSSNELATDNLKNIWTALENKLLVGGLFCDFTKEFDCMEHDILLAKL